MNCGICEMPMREFDNYYKCSNKQCGIKMNKCIQAPKKLSLYPTKQPRFTSEETNSIIGVTAVGLIILSAMVMIGYLAILASIKVV